MKKITLTIFTVLVLTLTACGGASNNPQAGPADPASSSENTLPLSTQLLIGTFKLEDTDLAVTAEQASELIPLWQVLQSISSSDNAAQEEMDALVEQIQETMTAEQVQAIEAMNLTSQDMFTIMQEQGLGGGGPMMTQGTPEAGSNGDFPAPPAGGGDFIGPAGGGPPGGGGGPGGGGPGGGGGQGLSPDQIATAQANRAENGGGGGFRFNGAPAPLIEALVKFLQEKAG
ncbi:MAG TPA: hypothetical protein VMJ90_05735 [Anaerolineales bacterium]|nr:hypothetical protein [Anaerolineales bacterium]